jgi:hypothetical protein
MEITKKQSFRTAVSCIQWLLAAARSFSLRLLQNHPGRQMRTGGRSYTRTIRRELKAASNGRRLFFSLFLFTWIPSFLFLFPRALGPEMLFRMICQGSRKQTAAVEPPSFFCSSSFNNLALRLFPFPDISAGWPCGAMLPSSERKGAREREVLRCRGERVSILLQLVADHVHPCICGRSS